MTRSACASLWARSCAEIGESPLWCPALEALLWLDLPRGVLFGAADSGEARVHRQFHHPVGSIGLAEQDGFVLAHGTDVSRLVDPGAPLEPIARCTDANARLNDGRVDPWGAFVVGSASIAPALRSGALFRVSAEGEVSTLLGGIGMSNGLDWSCDRRELFFVDTATGCLDAFEVFNEGRRLGLRRTIVKVPREDGLIDGLTVDTEDTIWVAIWGRGEVRRYSPAGDLLIKVLVDTARPTSCAFGGRDKRRLFITSARSGESSCNEEHADFGGSVFVWDAPVSGQADRYFGRRNA